MKFSNILSLFVLVVALARAENKSVNSNGKQCKLRVFEIKCVLVGSGEDCETLKTLTCPTIPDPSVKVLAEYTFKYKNKGSKKIKFVKESDTTGNLITFANANTQAVNIQLGKPLKPGMSRKFTVQRTLFPCKNKVPGIPRRRFVAEHRMEGFIVGKPNNSNFKCKASDFFSHRFNVVTPPPSPAPTAPPTASPSAMPSALPTKAPSKGKGKKSSKK